MNGDRAHDEVVSDLSDCKAGCEAGRRSKPTRRLDTLTVTEGDVSVRMSAIGERVTRLEQDLSRVERADRPGDARSGTPWSSGGTSPSSTSHRRSFQLTLDDQIALLQGSIAERLDHER